MEWIEAIATPFIVGVLLFYFQQVNSKRFEKQKKSEDRRMEATLINGKVSTASAKLGYACAMALTRGEAHGGVEEGIKVYNEALIEKEAFLQKLNAEALSK